MLALWRVDSATGRRRTSGYSQISNCSETPAIAKLKSGRAIKEGVAQVCMLQPDKDAEGHGAQVSELGEWQRLLQAKQSHLRGRDYKGKGISILFFCLMGKGRKSIGMMDCIVTCKYLAHVPLLTFISSALQNLLPRSRHIQKGTSCKLL